MNWLDSRIDVMTAVFNARYPSSLVADCGAIAAMRCGRFSGFLELNPYAVATRHVCRDNKVIDEVMSVRISEGIASCAPGIPSAIVVTLPSSAPSAPSRTELPHLNESAT